MVLRGREMSKEFEEWARRRPLRESFEGTITKKAWNHQQKKIDQLQAELDRYKELVGTNDFLKHSDNCGQCQQRRKIVLDLDDKLRNTQAELEEERVLRNFHKMDLEFILEALNKINNQTFESNHRARLVVALISDIGNLLSKINQKERK